MCVCVRVCVRVCVVCFSLLALMVPTTLRTNENTTVVSCRCGSTKRECFLLAEFEWRMVSFTRSYLCPLDSRLCLHSRP